MCGYSSRYRGICTTIQGRSGAMKGFVLTISMVSMLMAMSCSNPVSDETGGGGETDIRGELTAEMYEGGLYYIPIEGGVSEKINQVYVRWSAGIMTYPDGKTEYIWTYWQASDYQLGDTQVVVSIPNFLMEVAEARGYWIVIQ